MVVPAAIGQHLGAFAPQHHSLGGSSGLTGDGDLTTPGCRDQPSDGILPEIRGQCWNEREELPVLTTDVDSLAHAKPAGAC